MENLDLNLEEIQIQEYTLESIEDFNKVFNIKDIYIIYVNIRSLNAKLEQLEVLISSLVVAPTIIVCTETWTRNQGKVHNILGYKTYYNEILLNQNDGVAIFVKENVKYSVCLEKLGLNDIISLDLELEQEKKIRITCAYRCHSYKKKFLLNIFINTYKKINIKST